MDESPEDLIRGELASGEKLLWAGRPRQGFFLRAADAFLIPFSLMWGGFAIVWEVAVLSSGAPWFFGIWGIPFVLVGLYIMIGRFWVDARERTRTLYAVTSERIIIVSGLLARRVKSLDVDTLSDVSLTERGNGSGMITFGPVPPWFLWYGGAGWPRTWHQAIPTFELADEARQVYEIIRGAQRAAKQRT